MVPGANTKLNNVKATGNNILSVEAYPNPSATEFTLLIPAGSKEKVTITVTDIAGRMVYEAEATGKQQFRFGNNFKPGMYIVQVIQADKKQSIKLTKE
jgi:hypothetical protein